MKKCKGCGVQLQSVNKDKEGYVNDLSFDYCQRCFRLTHYGDTAKVKHSLKDNEEIIEGYKNIKDALYVLIVDPFDGLIIDQDNLLKHFLDKDVLLVLNKIDLLPKNITDQKMEDLYKKVLGSYRSYPNIQVVLTYKNDPSFVDLFYEILATSSYKKAVFVGRVNAGKSSIINKLIGNHDLTVSIYPGTTTNFNELKFADYTFIDTPGLLDEESYITYLDNKEVKEVLPLKTLKAQNFQLYEDQAYFVEGLLEVQIKPKKKASVTFFINNNLEVHRTKLSNAESYYQRNKKYFKLKKDVLKDHHFEVQKMSTFFIKGLGAFKISGQCEVNVKTYVKIQIYKNEVNI